MLVYKNNEIPILSTTTDSLTSLNGDTIGMIVGLTISILILTALFIFIAYYCPWLQCYNLCCWRCTSIKYCDFIYCFQKCPCMEKRAYNQYIADNLKSNRIYEQNFLTTSDGMILEAGQIRPVGGMQTSQGYYEGFIA
jgi:hypothetical protein